MQTPFKFQDHSQPFPSTATVFTDSLSVDAFAHLLHGFEKFLRDSLIASPKYNAVMPTETYVLLNVLIPQGKFNEYSSNEPEKFVRDGLIIENDYS